MNLSFEHNRTVDVALHGLGITGVAVVLCLLFFVRRDVHAKLVDTQVAETDAIDLLQQRSAIVTHHQNIEQRLDVADALTTKLKATIPATAGEIDFMSQLSRLSQSTGFRIRDYRPGAIIAQPLHQEMEIRFAGEGSYAAYCRFLEELNELPRAYRISNLNVLAPKASTEEFNVEFQLRLVFALQPNLTTAGKTI